MSSQTSSPSIILPANHGNPIVMEAVNLSKSFKEGSGAELQVLKNVNLTVRAREKIAIIGASGSGKSTLLHLLGGLDSPTSGQVFIDDHEIIRMKEVDRCSLRNRKLGFIYQFHHLLPEFTAQENVAMPALIKGMPPSQAMGKADVLLEKVGMTRRLEHKPAELSGGERQRAAIARAMVNEPQCICADEPTGNLDKATAEQVFRVLLRLNQEYGTSLIIATHDMKLAEQMDIIYAVEDGHLIRQN